MKKRCLYIKKTFPDAKSFEEFHKERETKVFLDISEEMLTQRVELAIDYAESLQTKHNLPVLSQVFEEKDIRLAYIYKIKRRNANITKKSKRIVYESTGESYKYIIYIEGKSKRTPHFSFWNRGISFGT